MGFFVLALLVFCVGGCISFTQSSTCHAQCDYDHVSEKADCSSRNLNCIPSNFPNAVVMSLSRNNISVLGPDDFNGTFTRLKELYLDDNSISNLTSLMHSTNMGSLETLSVQHNVISVLPRECQLSSLENLIMDNNLLTTLTDCPECGVLKRFSANCNRLSGDIYFAEDFYTVPASISLQFNHMTNFSTYLYHKIPSNVSLLLDHNNLDSVHFVTRLSTISTRLAELSLTHNELYSRSFTVSFTVLPTKINIASNYLRNWNGIRVTSAMKGMLKELDMQNNSFDSLIQPDWAEGLQILNANDNILTNLSTATLQGFVNLTELHVANNRLLVISSSGLRQLTMLRSVYLDDNALTSLLGGIFLNQAELVELSVTKNQLSILHPDCFLGLESLERLYLAGNKLLRVRPEMFQHIPAIVLMDFSQNKLQLVDLMGCNNNMSNLRYLVLANNSIQDITTVLGRCNSLEVLDLIFNRIESVPGGALAEGNEHLSRLELKGNPLQCDCRLKGLRDWLINNPPSALPRCTAPPRHTGKLVTNLATSEMLCDPPVVKINVKHLPVLVGQTVVLSCSATGTLVPKLIWLDSNGTAIPDNWRGRFWVSRDSTLLIVSVKMTDQGIYTCLARNALNEAGRATVTLTIIKDNIPVTITKDLTSPQVTMTEDLTPQPLTITKNVPSTKVTVIKDITPSLIFVTMLVTLVVTLVAVVVVIVFRRRYTKKKRKSQEILEQKAQTRIGFRREIRTRTSIESNVNEGADECYLYASQSQFTYAGRAYENAITLATLPQEAPTFHDAVTGDESVTYESIPADLNY